MNHYGCLRKTEDPRDYLARVTAPYTGEFVDLSPLFPEKPYDQFDLGACVAHGTAAAVDFARAKAGLAPLKCPSRLFIYYQGRVRAGYPIDEDTGLQIRDGFTVIAKDGVPAESDWSYNVKRFAERPPDKAYADAELDQAIVYGAVKSSDIDATIASGYPVVFGFDVYESFESRETAHTGIMPIPKRGERALGGHCVVFVSTVKSGAEIPGADPNVLYRKARNSWGHDGSWGLPADPGYFYFPISEVDDGHSSDFWMVSTMEDDNKPVPPPEPVPVDADRSFAEVLHPWVAKRHTGSNHTTALAAKTWLAEKRL